MLKLWKTDVRQARKLASDLAKQLRGGEILALVGPLGSGKTTFAKYLAKQLGVKRNVTSPTFVLMNVYPGRLKTSKKARIQLYHLDLYRCKNFREAKTLGITESWGQPNTITLLEWADKIAKHLPAKTIFLKFKNGAILRPTTAHYQRPKDLLKLSLRGGQGSD